MPLLTRKEQEFNDVGRLFYGYGDIILAALATQNFLFRTNDAIVDLEDVFISGLTGDFEIKIYEAPTVTAEGVALPVQAFNLRLDATPKAELRNGSVTVSAKGTEIAGFTVFAASGQGNQTLTTGVSQTSQGAEWKLKPDTDYLIEISNVDTTNAAKINFQLNWIENNS
jgi:hypothetical protein